jgi:ribosomal protein L11 methyltransferase
MKTESLHPVPSPSQSLDSTPQALAAGLRTPDPGPRTFQRWHCLSVTVPHEAVEAVANFLVELGSIGVVEGVHDFAQPPPSTTEVQGFFPLEASGPALSAALTRYLAGLAIITPGFGLPTPRLTEVSSNAWQDRWREHFPPLRVGKRFLLLPPWETVPTDTDRIVIVINPSMAFGTGHHATTQGCLEMIEQLHDRHGAPGRALDLGTGSGILAIALAKLGTPTIWATDTDPVALDEAHKNIRMNQVASTIQLSTLAPEQLPAPFALIVANLFSTTLIALAPVLRSSIRPQGYAILSGIQLDQEHQVMAAYPTSAWRLSERLASDEWVTLTLQHT